MIYPCEAALRSEIFSGQRSHVPLFRQFFSPRELLRATRACPRAHAPIFFVAPFRLAEKTSGLHENLLIFWRSEKIALIPVKEAPSEDYGGNVAVSYARRIKLGLLRNFVVAVCIKFGLLRFRPSLRLAQWASLVYARGALPVPGNLWEPPFP